MKALALFVAVLAGCNQPAPPAKEGQKCYYGDLALGGCEASLFCKPEVVGDQFVQEKVGFDKTVAIGTCRQPVKLGKPCDRHDLCEGGKCVYPTGKEGTGTCEGG